MSGIDILYEWNQRYGTSLASPGMRPEPRSRVVMLTCMDARVMPSAMFGVQPGDVHVLRNAGALATDDVIRSVVVSQTLLGTDEVMVVMHTRCGLLGENPRELRERVRHLTGSTPTFDFMAFADIEARLEETVRTLRRERVVVGDVRGFIFDVDTGALREHPVR